MPARTHRTISTHILESDYNLAARRAASLSMNMSYYLRHLVMKDLKEFTVVDDVEETEEPEEREEY